MMLDLSIRGASSPGRNCSYRTTGCSASPIAASRPTACPSRSGPLNSAGCDPFGPLSSYRGAIRIAPSRRIVSPLSIAFATIALTNWPYSLG